MERKRDRHYVNWVDGMKLGRLHFEQQYRAIKSDLSFISSQLVNRSNYGLLPLFHNGKGAIDCEVAIESPATIHLELRQVLAISRSGTSIEFLSSEREPLKEKFEVKLTSDDSEKFLYLVIVADHYNPEPFGDPDPSESPLRHPGVRPRFRCELMKDSDLSKDEVVEGVPVAKIMHKSGELVVVKEYIPPCFSIDSHPDLISFYNHFIRFLRDIENSALQMIYRMNSKKELSPLAINVQALSVAIIHFTEREVDDLTYFGSFQSPMYILASASRLARTLKLNLELQKGRGKEEMLQYFAEWTKLKPGEYEDVIGEVLDMRYKHNDVNGMLEKILAFCKVNGKLFKDLSQLDYIGKRKESTVFVAEKTDFFKGDDSKSSRKWEF